MTRTLMLVGAQIQRGEVLVMVQMKIGKNFGQLVDKDLRFGSHSVQFHRDHRGIVHRTKNCL